MGYKAEELLNRDRKIKGQEEIFNDTMKAWKTYKNAVEGLDVTDPKQIEKARQLGELYQIAIQRSKFNHPEVMYKSGGQVKIKRNSSDS
jgi:Ribonuclease G/E